MKISEATAKKILKLCKENKLSVNKLAGISNITQSTLQNIIGGSSKNPKLLTIIRICNGLNMELKDFFDDDIFKKIDARD